MLKIAYPHDEAIVERHALTLWAGDGAVRLLASDAEAGALLLERLDAGPLAAGHADGGRRARLGQHWCAGSAWCPTAGRSGGSSATLPPGPNSGAMNCRRRWEQLGRPFPRWLLEAALEVCQTRGAVGRRAGKDVLVHTDLHFLNILARPGTAGRPGSGRPACRTAGYAAIDPQPMIGEAEFAVAPLLWNRIRELDRSDPERGLLERCRDFSAAAGLDAEAARQWSLAREVENALWYASNRRARRRPGPLALGGQHAGRAHPAGAARRA